MSLVEQLDMYEGLNHRAPRDRVLTVRVEPQLHHLIKEAAARERISMNGYVVAAVRTAIEHNHETP